MSYQSLVAFEGWTFIAQILNLFIQMYLFKKFLFKPIQNILAQRQQEVDTLYADADSAKQDAESAKAEYESHLLTARTEAEEITARAVKNAQTRSDAMLASAQSEAAAGKPFAHYWMHNGYININKPRHRARAPQGNERDEERNLRSRRGNRLEGCRKGNRRKAA